MNETTYLELVDIVTVLKVTSGTLRRISEAGRPDPGAERMIRTSQLAVSAASRLERVLLTLDPQQAQQAQLLAEAS